MVALLASCAVMVTLKGTFCICAEANGADGKVMWRFVVGYGEHRRR